MQWLFFVTIILDFQNVLSDFKSLQDREAEASKSNEPSRPTSAAINDTTATQAQQQQGAAKTSSTTAEAVEEMSDGVDAAAVPLAIVTDAVAPAAAAAAPSSPQNRPITAGRFCIEKVHTIDEGERAKDVLSKKSICIPLPPL